MNYIDEKGQEWDLNSMQVTAMNNLRELMNQPLIYFNDEAKMYVDPLIDNGVRIIDNTEIERLKKESDQRVEYVIELLEVISKQLSKESEKLFDLDLEHLMEGDPLGSNESLISEGIDTVISSFRKNRSVMTDNLGRHNGL